jgi:hypothetical protein
MGADVGENKNRLAAVLAHVTRCARGRSLAELGLEGSACENADYEM